MSITNPNKPDNYSFLQCAIDFECNEETHKLPSTSCKQNVGMYGFLYHYTEQHENFSSYWPNNTKANEERIETITYFLLLNAAIEGEI